MMVAAALAAPPTIAGASPTPSTSKTVEVSCRAQNDLAQAYFSLSFDDAGQLTDGYLWAWLAPDLEETGTPPAYSGSGGEAIYAGGQLSASIPVVDAEFNPAGSATVTAAFVSSGPVEVEVRKGRIGNHIFFSKDSRRRLELSGPGSLTLPNGTRLDLSAPLCEAEERTARDFITEPASLVFHEEQSVIRCSLDNGVATGSLRVDFSPQSALVRASTVLPTGESIQVFSQSIDLSFEPLPWVDRNLLALVPYEPGTGWATLDLDVGNDAEPYDYILRTGTLSIRYSGSAYPVTGSITFPGEVTFDLGHCYREDGTVREISRPFTGPSPAGLPPANDLPAGAELLAAGDQTTAQTKSAAPAAEAPYECLPGGTQAINTVWYRIEGTGLPITIDTSGSNFDTAIAVYTADGSGGYAALPGGCVDDIALQPVGWNLQAGVTFDMAAGQTYLVQIGGAPDGLNWGTLRVAVR